MVERYDRTLVLGLRKYISEYQKDWSSYLEQLTHAFSTQMHKRDMNELSIWY